MLSARNTRIWPTSYAHRAALRASSRAFGLSLCDRACLALAQSLALPALTADRSWARLDLGIAIEVIR
jgi:ribonuclease VapC